MCTKKIEAVVLDERGAVLLRDRFPSRREALQAFARRRLQDCRVALEATTNTWAVVGLLTPLVKEVVVSNPLRTRAIASAKIKTDKVDARWCWRSCSEAIICRGYGRRMKRRAACASRPVNGPISAPTARV